MSNSFSLAPSLDWSNVYPIVTLVLSISMFCAFLVWEHRFATEPVMPLRIFRTPTFLALILVVLSTYMSWGIVLWYSIAWQQTLRDVSVLQTGIHFVPSGISALIAVVLAAYLLPRVAAQWIMASGIAVVFAASLLLATMPVEQTYWAQVFPAMLICGFCPDFVYVAAQSIASNSVGRKYQGIAGSLIGTLNSYGNSLGMGFAGTIEAEVIKRAGKSVLSETMDQMVSGYRAALYFSAGIAGMALLIDFIFVRVPKSHGGNCAEE